MSALPPLSDDQLVALVMSVAYCGSAVHGILLAHFDAGGDKLPPQLRPICNQLLNDWASEWKAAKP